MVKAKNKSPGNALVVIENNTPITTSLIVAEQFSKNHAHIMRDIRDIIGQAGDESKIGFMFHESNYADKYGREKPMYLITRDGFSLLAMGFTGAKALQFKLKFIDAFNRMEAEITAAKVAKLERAEREWQYARRNGIDLGRKPFTKIIQMFNIRDFPLGDKDPRAQKRYPYLTWQLQIIALRIPKGKRDYTTTDGLEILHVVEKGTANILNDVFNDDGSFELAAARAVAWAKDVAKTTGRDKLPLPPRTSKRKLPCIPLLI